MSSSIFVRVFTDEGITGIGECSPMNCHVIATFINHALRPLLLGKNPLEIDKLWHELFFKTYKMGVQGIQPEAIAGIDIALWDILGKKTRLPVHVLLGGAFRDRMQLYASIEQVQDGFHFWTFLATGETVLSGNDFTTQGSGQGLDKYIPVPELAIVHEEHLRKLYDSGYKLITIHDYVTGLENRGEYKMLERYVPETTWRDLPGFNINRDDSNGLFTWMGFHTSRGNATHPGNDDGDQLAETYRTSNVLKAIKTLLLANWNELAPATRDDLNASLVNAYKLLFKAEGTDPVGWEPGWITDNVLHETDYSRNHNRWARQLAWTVLQNLSVTLGLGDAIQVYTGNMSLGAGHAAFSNTTATWMNETCTPTSLSLDDLPVHLSLELDTGYGTHSAEVSNCTWGNHAYTKVDITVPETTGLRLHVGSGYPFWYSPTFYENRAIEYTLEGDEPFFLPLSNGLYFSGNETQGMAVIKNCSSRHVAFMASREFTGYFEKTSLRSPYTVKDVHYSFIMIQGSLQEALALANFVNTRPTITLDVTSG